MKLVRGAPASCLSRNKAGSRRLPWHLTPHQPGKRPTLLHRISANWSLGLNFWTCNTQKKSEPSTFLDLVFLAQIVIRTEGESAPPLLPHLLGSETMATSTGNFYCASRPLLFWKQSSYEWDPNLNSFRTATPQKCKISSVQIWSLSISLSPSITPRIKNAPILCYNQGFSINEINS